MKRTLVAVIVGLVGLTGCGSARSLGTAPSSPAVQTSPSPSEDPRSSNPPKPKAKTTPTPKPSSAPAGSMSCASTSGGHDVGAQLVDVRVGRHDTYDRVTFEFSGQGGVPAFDIRAVTTVTEDASGRPLSLQGSRYAEIVFQNASGYDLTGNPTYQGPSDFRPGYPALAEARAAGDFERVLSWGFGLNDDACWQVLELDNPVRLAVDFQH